MAGQRRYARQQADAATELKAWRMVFRCGHDFTHALRHVGVEVNDRHQPDPAIARDAWGRLGDLFLADAEDDPRGDPWALQAFGPPSSARAPKPRGRRR